MAGSGSVPVESLLAQREWVRRVARALVAGEADADDLEQEVWLRALEQQPRHAGSVRSWFRAVIRHKARDLWRAESRRRRVEESVPAPMVAASTADLVAEADAHRRVVDAVMALDEPYRATIVLRYFHELSVAEVSLRMGVPRETTRTRLRRGLALLRDRFDADSGGSRPAWIAAVLPLTYRAARTGSTASSAVPIAVALLTVLGVAVVGLTVARGYAPAAPEQRAAAREERATVVALTRTARSGTRRWAEADDPPEPLPTAAPDAMQATTASAARPILAAGASSGSASPPGALPDAFDEAFAVVNDPGEANPAKLARTIDLLHGLIAAGVREGQCRVGLGRCLFRLGHQEEARAELESALKIGGFGPFTRSWAWLRLGCIADLAQDRNVALAYYRAVVELPDAPNLRYQKWRATELLSRPYSGYSTEK